MTTGSATIAVTGASGLAQTFTNVTMSGASNTFTNISLTASVTGTLPLSYGGTNGTTATSAFDNLSPLTSAGDTLYYNGTHNVRLAAGTATQVLHGGTTPSWSAVSLTADVVGNLPFANGGTAGSTAAGGFNNLNPMTTIGDLIYESGTNVASRLGIGTTSQVLTVVGGVPAWAAAGGGTVTSVALTVPSFLSVSGSPITSSGTLAVTLTTETAATVFAGPLTGGAATPTFRALAGTDLPAITQTTAGVDASSGQRLGTNTNDSASAGNIGELKESITLRVNAVSLTSSTDATVLATAVTLGAGQWDIYGFVGFRGTTTALAAFIADISTGTTTPGSPPTNPYSAADSRDGYSFRSNVTTGNLGNGDIIGPFPIATCQIATGNTQTINIAVRATFTGGTCLAWGRISAKRVR